MSYSRKLIYNPQKLYKSDINDLVEEDMIKGGPGSGIKGHKTFAEAKRHMRQQEDAKHGRLDKLRGHNQYWQEKYKSAKQAGHKEHTEHYRKLRDEAVGHLMNRLSSKDLDDKLSEPQKMKNARHGIKHEEDDRSEAQKMADMRQGGPGFKRNWK